MAIADKVGGDWPEAARQASLELSRVRPDQDDQIGVELLADIKTVFDEEAEETLATATILTALCAMDERPWSAFGQQEKPPTGDKLARLLRPFGIVPGDIRFDSAVKKGYGRAAFDDSFARYLDAEPQQRNTANEDGP